MVLLKFLIRSPTCSVPSFFSCMKMRTIIKRTWCLGSGVKGDAVWTMPAQCLECNMHNTSELRRQSVFYTHIGAKRLTKSSAWLATTWTACYLPAFSFQASENLKGLLILFRKGFLDGQKGRALQQTSFTGLAGPHGARGRGLMELGGGGPARAAFVALLLRGHFLGQGGPSLGVLISVWN